MEENKGLETGVEEVSVADLEPVVGEVAEVVEPTPEPQPEPAPEQKFEKAFAKRLSKEAEKIAAETEAKYTQKLSKFEKVLEIAAKENGIDSIDDYVEALLEQYAEPEKPEAPMLDPESLAALEEIKEQRKQRELESEKKTYWDRQAKLLREVGVTDLSQIPDEVLERALENDTDVVFEYLLHDKQQAIKNTEKETIRKLQEQDTPGSMSFGGADEVTDISNLKWNDPKFEELKKRVLSGERVKL